MIEETREDPMSDAFARALGEAAGVPWRHDPGPDLAARSRRRRRSQFLGVALAVLLTGGAAIGWRLAVGGDAGTGTAPSPAVTAPPTTSVTTTTRPPCPDQPDPTDPCSLPGGLAPGAAAIPLTVWRGEVPGS